MSYWKQVAVVATTALTLLAGGALTASVVPGGNQALKGMGSLIVRPVSEVAIDAQAAGTQASGSSLNPIQVSIGTSWSLTQKLQLAGTVTVTCDPLLYQYSGGYVQISQATGQTVAHAYGNFQTTCDGSSHVYPVTTSAANAPFHSGSGLAEAQVYHSGVDPGTGQFTSQSAVVSAKVTIRN